MPYTDQDIRGIVDRVAELEALVRRLQAEVRQLQQRTVLQVERVVVGTDRNRVLLDEQGIRMGCGKLAFDAGGSMEIWREGQPSPDVVVDHQGVTLYEQASLQVLTQDGPLVELNPPHGWLRVSEPRGNGVVSVTPDGITVKNGGETATVGPNEVALERRGGGDDDYLRLRRGEVAGARPHMPSWPGAQRFRLYGSELLTEAWVDNGGQSWQPWHAVLNPRQLQLWERDDLVGHAP